MSTTMTHRYGMSTGDNSSALLMMVGEQHKKAIEYFNSNLFWGTHFAAYIFMCCFENAGVLKFNSGVHYFTKEVVIGEPTTVNNETLYPVRANLEISLGQYDGLRRPYRERNNPFPEYTKLVG